MIDPVNHKWCESPLGLACRCIREFTWPEGVTELEQLGSIECEMRSHGGFNTYNVKSIWLKVEGLVLASEWALTRHTSGLTVRGAPVTTGSPLALGVGTSAHLIVAGCVLEKGS